MTVRCCLYILWGALLPLALQGQATSSRAATGLTLDAAVDSALKHNWDVRTSIAVGDSARAETRIARAYPNPTVSAIPNTPFQYAATLPIDVGPQRVFRTRVSDLGARAARSDIQESARQVVLAVRRAFYDVLLADAKREVVAARRGIMAQLVAADSARVRVGELPARALTRSQVELLRTETDLARAGIDAQSSRLVLQGLMGVVAADTALVVNGELRFRDLSFDTGGDVRAALARRPDIESSRIRDSQSVAAQKAARSLVLPVPQVTYVRQFNGPFDSGHYYAFGLGFELPVLNRYGGQKARADAAHEAAGVARRRIEAQATREIQSTMVEFLAQRALVLRYEAGVITKMEEGVAAARYAYARGATSLLEVLDALRTQQDATIEYRTALHDYWVAAYSVEAANGIPPR